MFVSHPSLKVLRVGVFAGLSSSIYHCKDCEHVLLRFLQTSFHHQGLNCHFKIKFIDQNVGLGLFSDILVIFMALNGIFFVLEMENNIHIL